MFYEYYNLTTLPFQEHVAPQDMLLDGRFNAGLERFDYFLHGGLVATLTGPSGVGKSSLLRLFRSRLPANRYHEVYTNLTQIAAAALLRMLVTAFGETPRLGKDRLFAQIIDKARAAERTTVIIIDEAHLLEEEPLTDLRLLLSTSLGEEMKLKLLLCGQHALTRTLSRSRLADLANRIAVRWQLFALNKDQTLCYLDHRLKAAGGTESIFDDEAKERLHDFAGGIPRVINNLATLALIQGAAKQQKRIGLAIVDEAAAELRLM